MKVLGILLLLTCVTLSVDAQIEIGPLEPLALKTLGKLLSVVFPLGVKTLKPVFNMTLNSYFVLVGLKECPRVPVLTCKKSV